MGEGVNMGTGGGARFGGEPERSGVVTRKNSSVEPILFWGKKEKHEKLSYSIQLRIDKIPDIE